MQNWQEEIAADYERALTRLVDWAKRAEVNAPFSVYAAIEELKERFEEAEDWSEEEMDALLVDLDNADSFLKKAGRSLLDWLRLDAAIIEEKMFSALTDETKLAWLKLRQQAQSEQHD